MPTLQVFDVIVLILVGYLTLRGMLRGVVAQILSIVSLVVCWIVAVKFSPVVAPMVSYEPPWNRIIAMLLLFVGGFVAFWLLRGLLDSIIRTIRLKSADRSLGAVLGFAKGVFLCLIITFFLVVFSESTRNFALESVSGRFFAHGIERISVLIPKDAGEVLSKNIAKFQESLEKKFGTDPKPLDLNPLINQVKESFAGVLSLKDIETQSTPTPSLLREKIASSPTITEPPKQPTEPEPARRTVLPFQPK
ncbi:MAG: CvpA family protein [Planctomycetaceae bacterium]|nr:CvpA family protein [Planctomycetaceae bacterium]